MNQIKLLKLIEGVRQADDFKMHSHRTCICGVGYRIGNTDPQVREWLSSDLARWLEWPQPEGTTDTPAGHLVTGNLDATKAQAIAVLEHLRDTGKVDWSVAITK